MCQSIQLVPIGFVSSPVKEGRDTGWGSVVARVTLQPEYAGATQGLESFSHALIVTYLHQARFDPVKHLKRHPQDRNDMPELGIFAQRAKNRPNPIGITAVKIQNVENDYLEVKGLDAIEGTPVLDIKPYCPCFDRVASPEVPSWINDLMKDYF